MHHRLPCTWCGFHLLAGDRCWRCGEPDQREARELARAEGDGFLYDWNREIPRVLNPWVGLLIPEQRSMIGAEVPGAECEHCASRADGAGDRTHHGPAPTQVVRWQSGRSAYHWSGRGLPPNRPSLLCEGCAIEYHENWDEMWDNIPH